MNQLNDNDLRMLLSEAEFFGSLNENLINNVFQLEPNYIGFNTINENTPDVFTYHQMEVRANFLLDGKEQTLLFTNEGKLSNLLHLKHDNAISTDDWLNSLNLSNQDRQTMDNLLKTLTNEVNVLGISIIKEHQQQTPMQQAIDDLKKQFEISPIYVNVEENNNVYTACTISYKDMNFVVPMSNYDDSGAIYNHLHISEIDMTTDMYRLHSLCSDNYKTGNYSVLHSIDPLEDMFDSAKPFQHIINGYGDNDSESDLVKLNNLEIRALHSIFQDAVQNIKANEVEIMKQINNQTIEQEFTTSSMKP